MTATQWDDDLWDLLAMVSVGRQDEAEPGRHEALRAVAGNCDRDGVLAAALKLICELVTDLGMCDQCLRQYAVGAIARALPPACTACTSRGR